MSSLLGPGFLSIASFGFAVALFKGWIPYSQDANVLTYVFMIVMAVVVLLYSVGEARFTLYFQVTGRTMAFFPVYVSRLGKTDIVSIIILIVLKYILKPIGLVTKLRPAADGTHFDLPELKLDATIKIDEGDEARYDAATNTLQVSAKSKEARGISSDRLLLLPGLTTPLMSTLLANRNCPVLALGSVNTKNRFEFIDPDACRDPKDFLDLSKATVTARLGGEKLPGRRVKRGMEFDIQIELKAPRKGTKQIKVVFRQLITILAFLPSATKPHFKAAEATDREEIWTWSSSPVEPFELDASAPFRWASVCADYNPIHVSKSMAKMFGFASTIAHGNHVLAVALQQMHDRYKPTQKPTAEHYLHELLYSGIPSVLEVQFKRPMVLPVSLSIEFGQSGKEVGLRAVKDGKEHVTAWAMELKP